MSALFGTGWQKNGESLAAEMTSAPDLEKLSIREVLLVARDTMIVFAMQVVFRVSTLLRHLNY
jgi:hypothetical protein